MPKRTNNSSSKKQTSFPTKFPFWARLKFGKKRTTLVIDEDKAFDKQKKKTVDGFVHREATSVKHKDYEEISPNPDKSKKAPMYLKRPKRTPKHLFENHNKDLDMPNSLKKRYGSNNNKK